MAGKTGTAQVIGIAQNAVYKEDEVDERHRHHGLFIAFAPGRGADHRRGHHRGERRRQFGGLAHRAQGHRYLAIWEQ